MDESLLHGDVNLTNAENALNNSVSNASLKNSSSPVSSEDEEDNATDKSYEIESSGIFIAGYTGPIHRWQHTGYQFIAESAEDLRKNPVIKERTFKVIIVGDATVGKTSFVQRYTNNEFRKDYKGTVGVDFALKVLERSRRETIKLQLWDIAGQERFAWMTRAYYREAHGCIVMFDLTSNSSFINAIKWKKDVDAKCHLPDGSLLPAILLGNKCDVPHRAINQNEVEFIYKMHNYIGWTEVSAKTGLMVQDCMKFLIEEMINRDIGIITLQDDKFKDEKIAIQTSNNKKKTRCCLLL